MRRWKEARSPPPFAALAERLVRLVFTDELEMPEGGARRFLIVRTDRDVTLLDLEHLDRPEVTLVYSESQATTPPPPLQVVCDDGDPDDPTDALLAVRLGGEFRRDLGHLWRTGLGRQGLLDESEHRRRGR